MSVESDLEAFRYLALEEQIKIPWYLEQNSVFGLSVIYENLDPLLVDIVGGHEVSVIGEMYLPDLDDDGHIVGVKYLENSYEPVTGQSYGITIGQRAFFGGSSDMKHLIGYLVTLPEITRASPVEHTTTRMFAFAPVENSTLHVPGLKLEQEMPLPSPQDVIAANIDEVVLNDPKNFSHLNAIFRSLARRSELKVDYYLHYLNIIFPLKDYKAELVTEEAYIDDGDNYISLIPKDSELEAELGLKKFVFAKEIGGLCLLGEDEDDGDIYVFPLRHLSKIVFRKQSV